MNRSKCPVCQTPISYARMQYAQSGRMQAVDKAFACPNCTTQLRWSIRRWRWLGNTLLVAEMAYLAYLYAAQPSPDVALRSVVYSCCGIIVVMLLIAQFAQRLVVDGDE